MSTSVAPSATCCTTTASLRSGPAMDQLTSNATQNTENHAPSEAVRMALLVEVPSWKAASTMVRWRAPCWSFSCRTSPASSLRATSTVLAPDLGAGEQRRQQALQLGDGGGGGFPGILIGAAIGGIGGGPGQIIELGGDPSPNTFSKASAALRTCCDRWPPVRRRCR